MFEQKKQEDFIIAYKHFLQYIVKKGHKHSLEILFRKGLHFWSQSFIENPFENTLKNAFFNTTPTIGVKVRRKGSKNIYIPKKLTFKHSKYLAAKWMLTNAFAKKKRNLHEAIIEELVESSLKKSLSAKKRDDLHKLAEESLVNFK